jgi:hypothetical protein
MAHLHLLLFIGMFFGCFVSVYTLAKICADRQEEMSVIKDIKSNIKEFKEELNTLKNNR